MHTRLHDDIGVNFGRLNGEAEGVAFEIADQIEDVRRHIIVGEDDRVFLGFERVDRMHERRVSGPFKFGNKLGDQRVEMIRRGFDLIRVGEGVILRHATRYGADAVLDLQCLSDPLSVFPVGQAIRDQSCSAALAHKALLLPAQYVGLSAHIFKIKPSSRSE